jgi:hypothetical protein
MKLYCVLEQSGEIPDKNTYCKKNSFSTSFSDFLRINWLTTKDPLSAGYYPGISWSEGRSILYELAKEHYEYLIFIDDDVRFDCTNDVADVIANLITEYKPYSATFYDSKSWGFKKLPKTLFDKNLAFPIVGFDLQTFLMKTSFAKIVMPVPFHGFDKSMWYAQYIANSLWPNKQVVFPKPSVSNARHALHTNDKQGLHPLHGDFLFWRFSTLSSAKNNIPRRLIQSKLAESNSFAACWPVNKKESDPSPNEIDCILDTSNSLWRNRKALMNYTYVLNNQKSFNKYKATFALRILRNKLSKKIKNLIKKIKKKYKSAKKFAVQIASVMLIMI